MTSAADKLQPSHLSDQREALGRDVDLSELALALRTRASMPILEMVTAGEINRTIEGASTLTLTLRDRDRRVRLSGILTDRVSIKVDGLWFRLVTADARGNDLTLSFEDREVNVLRRYPPTAAPHKGYLAGPVAKTTRAQFAKRLIDEAASELRIRFVCPALGVKPPKIKSSRDRPDPSAKRRERLPGLPPDAAITVQLAPATREQILNTDRVLDVGQSMGVSRDVMVVAVMVINQESRATNLPGGDRDSRGIFQQRQTGGRPDGGTWPSSLDIETDAHAFFEVAEWLQAKFAQGDPPADVNANNVAAFCSEIQRDHFWGSPQQGEQYARSLDEAIATVALYLGDSEEDIAKGRRPKGHAPKPPLRFDEIGDTAFMFTRGTKTTTNGRKQWKREDNWTCLQRLAEEVRWRCFCVSGAVYFISERDLFLAAPAATLTEFSQGVDWIDGRFDVGTTNAQVTVQCRADRWEAPPGTVVVLDETGCFDGRWIVTSIQRGLFNPAATVTLKKPRPALPESEAPEYGKGETSGQETFRPPKRKKPPAGERQPPPPGPPGAIADYQDPFRNVSRLVAARIDMGVDYAAGDADAIFAIGPARIDYVTTAWLGNPRWYCVAYTFTDGPAQGLSVYLAEYVKPVADWQVGQGVTAGTVLARFVPGFSFNGCGIEIGWAKPGTGTPVAVDVYPGGGRMTAFGADFSTFLSILNTRNAGRAEHPPPVGQLPAGWPRWRRA